MSDSLDPAVRARLEALTEHGPSGWDVRAALAALDAAEAPRETLQTLREQLDAATFTASLYRQRIAELERDFATATQARVVAEAERDDLTRRMHVYSPENQVTHCGCRLCGERQAIVRAAVALARGEDGHPYTQLLAAVADYQEYPYE